MISSFFSKTKPINYIVLSSFMVVFYVLYVLFKIDIKVFQKNLPLELVTIASLLLTIFVMNRIVREERVTDFNTYSILFVVLLFVAFTETLLDRKVVFCNLFLLMALMRLLGLKSLKNVKHKIFDASFLVGVASLFYDWALLFLVLVYLVVNVYDRKNIKNWMVAPMAILTLFILIFTILKAADNTVFFSQHYRFSFDSAKAFLQNTKFLVFQVLSMGLMLWIFFKTRKKGGGKLVTLRIVFLFFILGTVLNVFKNTLDTPYLITFFPVAVFLTNYLETIRKPRLKDLLLSFLFIVPFLVLIIENQ